MSIKEFLHNLTEEYGTAEFLYKGKKCGVEPETQNSTTTYCMWYGESWKDYKNTDDLIADKFFDGLSLADILPLLEVNF